MSHDICSAQDSDKKGTVETPATTPPIPPPLLPQSVAVNCELDSVKTFLRCCRYMFVWYSFVSGDHGSELCLFIAFEELLKNLPDLVLDTPDAATVLGNFIARAVADDCLPPKFVQICKDKVTCDHAR
jgi:hypothetical protein